MPLPICYSVWTPRTPPLGGWASSWVPGRLGACRGPPWFPFGDGFCRNPSTVGPSVFPPLPPGFFLVPIGACLGPLWVPFRKVPPGWAPWGPLVASLVPALSHGGTDGPRITNPVRSIVLLGVGPTHGSSLWPLVFICGVNYCRLTSGHPAA